MRNTEPLKSIASLEKKEKLKTEYGKNGNKLIVLKRSGHLVYFLFQKDKLLQVGVDRQDKDLPVMGDIYIAKLMNKKENMTSAFFSLDSHNEIKAFLDTSNLKQVACSNRNFDGRFLQGDEILVQVVQEAQKNKNITLSAQPELLGRFLIIKGGSKSELRFSSKLSRKVKDKLLSLSINISSDNIPIAEYLQGYSVMFRSNVQNQIAEHPENILTECVALKSKLEEIIQYAQSRTCYSCLYKAPGNLEQFLTMAYESDFEEIVTDDVEIYEQLKDFYEIHSYFGINLPIRLYQDDIISIDKIYRISTQVQEALGRKVWLPCGGYLIIDPTEAMTVIDVNSGKNEKQGSKEQMALQVNLEAAKMIALQLSLRNLSGMILVDFINMKDADNNKRLITYLQECLSKDRQQAKFVDITKLGIIEITRHKENRPLSEELLDIKI